MPRRSNSRSRSRSPRRPAPPTPAAPPQAPTASGLALDDVKRLMLEEASRDEAAARREREERIRAQERSGRRFGGGPAASGGPAGGGRPRGICRDYLEGNCFRGNDCRFSHDPRDRPEADIEKSWQPPVAASGGEAPAEAVPVEKPNFGLSGLLAADARTGNVYKGFILKFCEPPEARNPTMRWRLYVFKGDGKDPLQVMHIHRQSAFLIGRQKEICDIHLEHTSISKQHAVLQYRLWQAPESSNGAAPRREVKPYIMDLNSANGTFLNGERVESQKYIELLPQDVLRFGASSREYVLLTDQD